MTGATLQEALRKRRVADAQRAIQKFKTMVPALREYARAETGNPRLKLKAGPNSMTDGKTIFLCPPVKLGREIKHNGMCDEIEYGKSVCPACEANDEMMDVLRHEIGHIVHGSFDVPSTTKADAAARNSNVLDGSGYSRFRNSLHENPNEPLLAHVNRAGHPYLSMAMLMAEDLRCDEARMQLHPELRERFFSTGEEYMRDGIERANGSRTQYIDMDLNAQAIMGFMFMARGHEIDGYFDDRVVEVLSSPGFSGMGYAFQNAAHTNESFELSLDFIGKLEDNDLCENDCATEEELEELLEELSAILQAVLGHGLGGEHGLVAGDKHGAGGGSADDELPPGDGLRPEDIAGAMEALALLGSVPLNISAPKLYYPSRDGRSGRAYSYSGEFRRPDEKDVVPALTAARLAFDQNARVERKKNQKSGRVSGKMLARRVPFEDPRLFASKVRPDNRSYHVVIGMDISGSTSGETLVEEKTAVAAMADVCSRLGISFELWAHTTEGGWWDGGEDREEAPALYCLKAHDEPWSDKQRANLSQLNSTGANFDGHTLRFYRKRVEEVRATDKILMYYTDGAMPAGNYEEELKVLKEEIAYCKKNDITLMAVGMGVDSPKEHGFDTAVIESSSDFRKVVDHLGKRLAN